MPLLKLTYCGQMFYKIFILFVFFLFQMKPRIELSVGCALTFLLLVGVSIAQDTLFECPRGKMIMTSRFTWHFVFEVKISFLICQVPFIKFRTFWTNFYSKISFFDAMWNYKLALWCPEAFKTFWNWNTKNSVQTDFLRLLLRDIIWRQSCCQPYGVDFFSRNR
jgi:hypothetical protein